MKPGPVIFLNGASSAGKSTLAHALREALPAPFLHLSFDHLREARSLPPGRFAWSESREAVFEGFHRSLIAFSDAGCAIVAEHIIETEAWRARLERLFAGRDVFLVAVRCALEELERRELARGDRRIGEARRDFETCYDFCDHDFEVDGAADSVESAAAVFAAWEARDWARLSRFRRRP